MITEKLLKKELYRQEKILKSCRTIINNLPEGNLVCKDRGNRYAMYRSVSKNGKAKQYSLKQQSRDKKLVEELKYKRCLMNVERKLQSNVNGMKRLLKSYRDLNIETIEEETAQGIKSDGWSFAEYDIGQGEKSLFRDIYLINRDSFTGNSKAEGNPNYRADTLKINTGMGFYVRSKSEMLICMKLKEYSLDFKYEHSLKFGVVNMHPDFTIILPNGTSVLWEHFGIMDEAEYKRSIGSKLKIYADNGYFPDYNLFMTYENSENPLDVENVERVVRRIMDISGYEI